MSRLLNLLYNIATPRGYFQFYFLRSNRLSIYYPLPKNNNKKEINKYQEYQAYPKIFEHLATPKTDS